LLEVLRMIRQRKNQAVEIGLVSPRRVGAAAVSDPVDNVRHTASATGDAMGNDQQGISYERSCGTAWYARICFSYDSS
jgi:hypothetical protein